MTAWNSGNHHESGAGYGFKVAPGDTKYFDRKWRNITLTLEGRSKPIRVNIDKDSFREGACTELINKEIGKWLLPKGLAPWPRRKPPKLCLEPISGNRFRLHK